MKMKWRTHIAISEVIGKSLDLPKDLEKALIQGAIEPDKCRSKYISHHHTYSSLVMRYIWKARLAYLEGKNSEAMRNLGRALHYVQDKSISEGILGLFHDSIEEKISLKSPPQDAIEEGFSISIPSPRFIRSIVENIIPKKDPDEGLRQACMYSAAIAKAIISDRNPPEKLLENFKSAKERYYKLTIPAVIVILASSLIMSIIMKTILYTVLGCLVGIIIERTDSEYHYLKEELQWFLIE
jgi:hypothetical protein